MTGTTGKTGTTGTGGVTGMIGMIGTGGMTGTNGKSSRRGWEAPIGPPTPFVYKPSSPGRSTAGVIVGADRNDGVKPV